MPLIWPDRFIIFVSESEQQQLNNLFAGIGNSMSSSNNTGRIIKKNETNI